MFEELKRIFSQSLIYVLGAVFTRAIAFLMIPVYTRYLTTRDYGIIELVVLTADIAGMILSTGFREAVLRFYFEGETETERGRIISTGLLYTGVIAGAATLALVIFSQPLAGLIIGKPELYPLLRLALINNFLDLMAVICLTYFRARGRSGLYSIVLVVRLFIALGLNILLVVVLRMGVMGILIGTLAATSVTVLVCLAWTIREVGFGFSRKHLEGMLHFGIPLIPASLAMFSLQFADRFFLRRYSTMEAIGIYSLAYKFGLVLSFFITEPFLLAWGALVIPIALRDDAREIFSRLLTYFMLVAGIFGLGLALVGPGMIRVMAHHSFAEAGKAVPILSLGFVALACSYLLNTGVHIEKKTTYRAINVAIAAGINILLNCLLIPRYGMMGASWATTLSFTILAVVSWFSSQRVYPIPYDLRRLAVLIGVALGIFWLAQFVPVKSKWASIGVGMIFTLAYPGLLYLVRFFSHQEIMTAKRSLRSLRDRGVSLARVRVGAQRD